MATIKQIAGLAGVSRGTVDRVLNNRGVVNPETAAKIREIAAAVHYTPNKAGKSLAARKKGLKLALVLFSAAPGNPFFDDVVAGAKAKAAELAEYGITVEVHYTEVGNWQSQVQLLEDLQQAGVNGIAIAPVNHPQVAAKIRALMQAGVPVVCVNTDIENSGRLAYVGSNYYQSGKAAGSLLGLITGGGCHVGVVTGTPDVLCHSQRVEGFCSHLAAHRPGMHIVEVVENHDDDFESHAVTKAMLQRHPEIDALYLAAAGVYGAVRAVKDLGLAGKVKIISFDAVPTTKQLVEEGVIAATIDQQPHKQGAKPLDILTEYLTMGTAPAQDCFYTNIEIRILDNI